MTCRVDEDIFGRALLDLLTPGRDVSSAGEKATVGRKKRFRPRKRVRSDTIEPAEIKPPPARIAVLEWLSSKTLSVCWSDPRTGHYADQVWRLGVARMNARCVLTGTQIRLGDSVFRPRASENYSPANKERMILASAVSDYPRDNLPT